MPKVPGMPHPTVDDFANKLYALTTRTDAAALGIEGEDLGSRLIDQSQKMTVAASAIAEKKTVGHRS